MSLFRNSSRSFVPALVLMATLPFPVMAETLEEAVRATVASHPTIEGAQAESGAALEEKKSEKSAYYPTVRVNGSAGRIYGDNATSRGLSVSRGAGYSNMWNGSIAATEKIFTGFETTNRIKSAESKKVSADMNVLDMRENLAYRAASSYVEVMRARGALALLKSHGAKIDDYLSRISKMVEDGGSDNSEYQQARDISVILQGLVDDYEGQVRAAESNYFDMTGHAPADLMKPALDESFLPAGLDDAISAALKAHPSLQAAAYSSQSAAYDVQAEKAPLYPSLEGELSYMKEEKRDLIGGEIEDGRATINLNWAFETGGGQLARIREKKHVHARAMSAVRETQKRVELGARLAWSEYQTALEQAKNQAQRLDLNTKLFDTYKIQFDGAKISLLQLMQADNQLFTAGLEKLNGEYRLLAAQYALLGSMGHLQKALGLAGEEVAALNPAAGGAENIEPAAGEPDEAAEAAAIEPSTGGDSAANKPATNEYGCGEAACGLLTQP